MVRNRLSLVLIAITALGLIGILTVSARINKFTNIQSLGIHRIADSTSGISFGSLAADGSGRLWVGGTVLGIQGLLLKSGTRGTMAQRVREVGSIRDLSFTNGRNGWMVADLILYHTRNAGRSWQRVLTLEDSIGLKTVCFINDRIGWVAGRRGLVLRTTDGGVTWSKGDTGIDFTIERIRFVTQDKGWAMGRDIRLQPTRMILLLTVDGGLTWAKAPDSDTQQFRSVIFVNAELGWAINSNDEILKSVDGGETWNRQRPSDGGSWTSIFFVSKSEGWAAGAGIIHTADGGKTWRYQLRTNGSAEESLDEIMFSGRRNGTVIGLTRVLITHNGGGTWKPLIDSWKSPILSRVRREKFKSASSK